MGSYFLHDKKAGRVEKHKGVVAWFNNAKGYGFISSDNRADVFVHYSAIQAEGYRGLKEGDEVEFGIVKGVSGKEQAERVLVVEAVQRPYVAPRPHGA